MKYIFKLKNFTLLFIFLFFSLFSTNVNAAEYICTGIPTYRGLGESPTQVTSADEVEVIFNVDKTGLAVSDIVTNLEVVFDYKRSWTNWGLDNFNEVITIGDISDKGNSYEIRVNIGKFDPDTYGYEFGLRTKGTNLLSKTSSNEECVSEFTVVAADIGNEPLERGCSYNETQYDVTNRFTCAKDISFSPPQIIMEETDGCDPSVDLTSVCNPNFFEIKGGSAWCLQCPTKEEEAVPKLGHNKDCNENSQSAQCDTRYFSCRPLVEGSINKCLYHKNTRGKNTECLVGSDECNRNQGLLCIGTASGSSNFNDPQDWRVGSQGKCVETTGEVYGISCTQQTDCEKYTLSGSESLGYSDSYCTEDQVCIFSFTEGEFDNIDKPVRPDEGEETNSPVIPEPPSRFIERCEGNLNCANCVARKALGSFDETVPGSPVNVGNSYSRFESYNEAATLEFDYNTAIDEWRASRGNNVSPTPPTTLKHGFVYTGYIYTSLGCIDTTDNGLITRVVQIALGITGAIILVRFIQAAMKLQGGAGPEERAEGVEIVTSAIVALLLFTLAIIGLRFIGVDMFQIFSPGTIEFAD